MTSWLEIVSDVVNASSIVLAARNSIHTWWTGIAGCALFATLFYESQLYADVVLQGFFILTSMYGWWAWRKGANGKAMPVTREAPVSLLIAFGVAVCIAVGYGLMLQRLTNAYAPFVDSLVLSLSVVAQLLLMRRRYETWWFWLGVNTLSVARFSFRGLWITAALYSAFWINAWLARRRWQRLVACR